MARRTRTGLIGGVVVAALVLMGAGFPTKHVPPERWATRVCTTVTDWVDATQARADDLNASLTGTNPKLRDIRDGLARYLGFTAHATTRALDGLEKAGTPATPKGAEAALALRDTFTKIRKSLHKLQIQAKAMSIKHKAKALVQVKALDRHVKAAFNSFGDALTKLRKLDPNHQLKRAFDADPACQALSS